MPGSIGATGATRPTEDAEAFAELLRGLKERSGLSYGALAKRLGMSTSTLHRYCIGSAVPTDYAPIERLARVCRATREEQVELHRRWILADAARARRRSGPEGTEPAGTGPGGAGPERMASASTGSEPREPGKSDEPNVSGAVPPAPARRRRIALIASVATVSAVGTALIANLPLFGEDDNLTPAGDTTVSSVTLPADATSPPASRSSAPSQPAKNGKPSASKSAEHTGGVTTERAEAVPVKVTTRPYVYKNPCNQHFLVDSEPEQVGPPAVEQDAPGWARAYGAVPSGDQRVALSVQGTGKDTVVLEALHVRIVTKGAPLAWNDYSMGVLCPGGGAAVKNESFDIDLDNGNPHVTLKDGQRDFPYKVSESDPEVFYVTARTNAHDVRWELALDWSSGDRHGTVHIDNNGTSFRTSARRPGYNYQPGSSEWVKRGG
ncbi:helix-turn-helix transcriptional regulator [Streptomyces sp. ME19-01-6]|nr:helix-turn-helix transcriptional regulator [Streptomyces sp. ME19-01-6]MDX3225261.1 helix-turn-helix transcriptional regulator [Streptomyces sp. ME19-01-6]